MMAELDKANQELDDLFAAARETPAALPDQLMMSILADATAARVEAMTAAPVAGQQSQPRNGVGRQLMLAIGGLAGAGGLVAASALGLWIGLAPPSFLPDPAQLVGYSDSTSVPYDSYDLAMMLGEEVQ